MASSRPDKLFVKIPPATLDHLPQAVRERLQDMRRSGAILSGFVRERIESQARRKLLHRAINLARTFAKSGGVSGTGTESVTFLDALDSLSTEDATRPRHERGVEVTIGAYGAINARQADKLSCEAKIAYFHMATEVIPAPAKELIVQIDIVHCLRRLRNVVVHFKPLPEIEEKGIKLSAGSPDAPGAINIDCSAELFFEVNVDDLMNTNGPKDLDLFEWFKDICDKHPAFMVFEAAVEEICRYPW